MTQAPDPLQAYYAARAAEYDRVYLKPERQADLRQIEAWLPARLAGRRLLEVACGTGYWTRLIAPVAAHLLAVDASPETLDIARRRVPAERVLFRVGDAYELSECTGRSGRDESKESEAHRDCSRPAEPSQRFDAAFAGFWWSHVPRARLREFLQGLHACLEPGARVVFLDNRFVPGSSTPVSEQDAQGDTWQQRRLDDGSTHRVLKNFPTEAALREAVAGLATDVHVTTWAYYWALDYAVTTPHVPPDRTQR